MGIIVSSIKNILNVFSSEKEVKILILGLSNAGKTTLLQQLSNPETKTEPIPTVAFNMESVSYNNIKMQVWDLGGQTNIRRYWSLYYKDTDAVIYVMDTTDKENDSVNKDELNQLLKNKELEHAQFLVLANKVDLPNSRKSEEIRTALNILVPKEDEEINIHVVSCSALNGDGIKEGMEWLANVL